jgi:hypothetical protein
MHGMATASHTWNSPYLDGAGDLLAAYFCGLPEAPYDMVQLSPFRAAFKRGKRVIGDLMGKKWTDHKTTLTVTLRPSAQKRVDWSFNFDFATALSYLFNDEEAESKIRQVLKAEVDGFCKYYLEFVNAQ